jgi:DNA-binding TFAR19-related protein (PDSD5 family)
MSRPLQRQTTREIEHVMKRAIIAYVHEEARAQLCQTAMMNAGVISALEEQLIQLSPLGSARYQAIADAFVIGTYKRLTQW